MKKRLFALAFLFIPFISSCAPTATTTLTFAQSEYEVQTGNSILVNEHNSDVNYTFVGEVPNGVNLDTKNGTITFSEEVINYSQVLYQAYTQNIQSDLVVLTLLHEQRVSNLSFLNLTDKIIDGDYILATNSEGYAISYQLKEEVYGVEIDRSSGRITFASSCPNNEAFTVIITAKNSQPIEKTFYTVTENLVTSINDTQACEENGDLTISYFLDFSTSVAEENILGVLHGKSLLDEQDYHYDFAKHQLLIKPSFLSTIPCGETSLSIVTSNNNVNVNLIKATKFIRTASDLASINNSISALNGYYILANDIDLTSYLALGGEGYNDNKGWNAIGTYTETTDGTATAKAFNGTFDGNGFAISGLKINRGDELAYNAGLFGYVDNLGLIKNLTVIADKTEGLNVRSYSGILTGNNQGKIDNCKVIGDITNYSGENLFKNLGLIAGTNGGEITNCIAEGDANSDAVGGVLVGSNEGTILNCYSYNTLNTPQIGSGTPCIDSYHFENIEDYQNFDFSDKLDSKHWNITSGQAPTTTQYLEYYSLFSIEIVSPVNTNFTKGDSFDIEVQINPTSLYDEYISMVEYSVIGEGVSINENKINTTNAAVNDIYVTITLEAQDKLFTDTVQYHVFDITEEIEIDENLETVMNAGSSYRLKANVYPFTANQEVNWKLSGTFKGVTLTNDIVTISDECTITSFSVYAYYKTIKSKTITIAINTFKNIENGSIVMYKDSLKDIEFEIKDVDLTDVKAYIDNSEIKIKEIKDNTIVISKDYLELIPDKTLKFKFVLNDGSMYRGYATYFSRELYDLEYVKSLYTQYHTISTASEFGRYLNAFNSEEEGIKYSSEKHQYYDDVFVLTNDIDFENAKMYGIGTYDSDTGTGTMFSGKIYGQGYSFKNINISDNEKWFTNEDKTGNYRNSLYATGFFGTFGGQIYDVIFDNVNVSANNWVAGFACTITESGYLENVSFVNSSVKSTGGTQGKIYCTNQGANNLIVVSFNGQLTNLGR